MASKKTKKKADHATAVPAVAMVTPQQKIDGGRKQIDAIKASADFAKAADVEAKVNEWSDAIDKWQANGKQITGLLAQVETLRGNEPILARRCDTKKRAVFSAITDYSDGSIDVVQGFGCAVLGHQALPPASMPQNLHDRHSKTKGTAMVGWKTMHGKFDFQVQYATDPADPATHADPIMVSKSTFKLAGQVHEATLHFRVLTLDPKLPGGKSDWTPWVPVIVG